ncbi:MAG: M23 family metallopeptidase [Oscillospiraceae bacterium]
MWQQNELSTVEDLKQDLSDQYEKVIYSAKKKTSDSGIYLYVQIAFMSVLLLTSFMLKRGNSNTFEYAKSNYKQLFESESVRESTFSYNSFMEKMKLELEGGYNQLLQAYNSVNGKGSANIYPSNVSTKKYLLKAQGVVPTMGYISSGYGVRANPFNSKQREFHTGIDIAAEKGTFIKSAFDGKVIKAENSPIAGNYITVQSEDNISTMYAHNQFLLVSPGEDILAGQVIATMGATGQATGPHLHFEILINGVRHNPIYALPL